MPKFASLENIPTFCGFLALAPMVQIMNNKYNFTLATLCTRGLKRQPRSVTLSLQNCRISSNQSEGIGILDIIYLLFT